LTLASLLHELYITIRLLIPAPNARPADERSESTDLERGRGVF
jgi:hypothetical protein